MQTSDIVVPIVLVMFVLLDTLVDIVRQVAASQRVHQRTQQVLRDSLVLRI